MAAETGSEPNRNAALAPDEAFAVLGNETRLEILQTLGGADGPLSFSEVYDRVDYDDTANFDYHLGQLVGHFVRKTPDGYELWEAGRRVVEAVLSGAVTDNPVREPTPSEEGCPFCGAPIEVGFQHARIELNCTECPGMHRRSQSGGRRFDEYGTLGYFLFPPAGVGDRTPTEMLEAAWTWMHADVLVMSTGVCSRCSADLDQWVSACGDHDASEGYCERCESRYAVQFESECPNCNRRLTSIAPAGLLSNTALLSFLTDHGVNPVAPDAIDRAMRTIAHYDEAVHSTDPFEGEFTFAVAGTAITLTVDDDLEVVDVVRHDGSESR